MHAATHTHTLSLSQQPRRSSRGGVACSSSSASIDVCLCVFCFRMFPNVFECRSLNVSCFMVWIKVRAIPFRRRSFSLTYSRRAFCKSEITKLLDCTDDYNINMTCEGWCSFPLMNERGHDLFYWFCLEGFEVKLGFFFKAWCWIAHWETEISWWQQRIEWNVLMISHVVDAFSWISKQFSAWQVWPR